MNDHNILLPGIVEKVSDQPPMPCKFPFFLVAYWPRGHWWKIQPGYYEGIDCPAMRAHINDLRATGWQHITIMRLPQELWA